MNKQLLKASFFLLNLLLVMLACKKIEQPEMSQLNQECDCAKEVSADFVIEEMTRWPGASLNRLTETDTIFKNKNVQFRALEDGASYTWYIGQEIIDGQITGRFFEESLAGMNIPITLVVKKKPNKICFPQDDGYDSITKIMHVSPYVVETESDYEFGSIEGKYRVKSPHLADSFDIILSVIKQSIATRTVKIENYNGLGDVAFCPSTFEYNYRKIYLFDQLNGYVHNRLDCVFEAKIHSNFPVGQFHYFGRRL
jgi:hypothetical protein